ncbi:MAG: hypothetical protein ABJO05_21150, partial [Roseibium sp.]
GDGQWRLFNIVKDPGETKDLAASEPQRFQRMLGHYQQYRRDNKVAPVPEGYSQMRQIVLNALLQSRKNVIAFLLTLLVLVPFYVAYKSTRATRTLPSD